jgi:hypothetical protein
VSDSTLLERLMPEYDATRIERRVLTGSPTEVWNAVLRADFVRTAEEVPAVRFLFGARSAAERALAAVRGRPRPPAPEVESMRLAELPTRGEWVALEQDPPREVVFGAVGRFWAGETVWKEIDASEFAEFDEPGLAKIACNFHLHACGDRTTLVTYECRTLATDPSARRAFMRYWRPLSSLIGVVLRAQLRVIESTLEEASRNA